jgi:hypothetical protein
MEPSLVKGRIQSGTALRAELITAACAATGQTAEAVTIIVEPLVRHLQENYGGDNFYIPKPGRLLDLDQIYVDYLARIAEREICRRHAISRRTLTRIIDEAIELGTIGARRTCAK